MKAVLALALGLTLLLLSFEAVAARMLPSGLLLGSVRSASYPFITLESPRRGLADRLLALGRRPAVSYRLTAGVRIRSEEGRYLVSGLLPTLVGKTVAMRRGSTGDVQEIWVLTAEEAAQYARRDGTRFAH